MVTSRTKNADATRADILTAARNRFAAESYESVSLRDVARGAGVDVALIARYFGSKEELFKKILLERSGEIWFGGKTEIGDLAEWLASLALQDGDSRLDDLERLYIILRSASSPVTARMISSAFVDDVFNPLARLLGDGNGGGASQIKAGLALSLVIGATVMNGIMSVEPVAIQLRDAGRRKLVRLLEDALTS